MFSALSRAITHVRAEEFSDIRTYGAPVVISEVMLFGKTPEQAKASPMAKLLGAGFLQSVDLLADALGFALDAEKRTIHEMAVATQPIDSPIGTIAPGLVAAQRFTLAGHGARRARDHGARELADGRRATSSRTGASGPRASASRSR